MKKVLPREDIIFMAFLYGNGGYLRFGAKVKVMARIQGCATVREGGVNGSRLRKNYFSAGICQGSQNKRKEKNCLNF